MIGSIALVKGIVRGVTLGLKVAQTISLRQMPKLIVESSLRYRVRWPRAVELISRTFANVCL